MQKLDENDELRSFRDHFHIPNFSGKRINLLYWKLTWITTKDRSIIHSKELDDWSKWGVEGHENAENPWISYHEIFIEDIKLLVGAKKKVVVTHSLTTNLHLLLVSFFTDLQKKDLKFYVKKKLFQVINMLYRVKLNFMD